MNKAELISAVAQQTGLTKKDSEAAIDAFVSVVETHCPNKKRLFLSDSVPLR